MPLRRIFRCAASAAVLVLMGVAAQPTPYPVLTYTQQRNDPQAAPARTALRTTGTRVTPYMADAFADSFGVNTRFGGGMYASQRPTVESFLVELGFRHIRDGSVLYTPEVRAYLQSLCTRFGIHSSLGLGDTVTDAEILQYIKDVPCVDMVEGPNEINGQPNWVQRLAGFMPRAYKLVRSTPAFNGIPMVGPSITKLEDGEQLAHTIDLSKYVDYGNKHSYPGQRNVGGDDGTGARGWGPTHDACPKYGYGAFFFAVCAAQVFTGDRPIWTTETGYASTPNGLATAPKQPPYASLPYAVASKYFPRLMAYEFANGITRTYIMALLDGASGCNGPFNALGLVEQACPNTGEAASLRKKPPFYALKSLMATVADPGPAFTPTPITMKIAGADAKLQTLLLQKRSGRYLLLYWVEASDWDVLHGTYQTVAPEPFTLAVGGMAGQDSAQNFGIDAAGSLTTPDAVRFSNGSAQLTATDAVQFFSFGGPLKRP